MQRAALFVSLSACLVAAAEYLVPRAAPNSSTLWSITLIAHQFTHTHTHTSSIHTDTLSANQAEHTWKSLHVLLVSPHLCACVCVREC